MNNRYIRLTNANGDKLYADGLMERGNLVKYRWLGKTIHAYGLVSEGNEWYVGIICNTMRMTYTVDNSLRITMDEDGIKEEYDFVYDFVVYPNCGEFPRETISSESHEIYLAKV